MNDPLYQNVFKNNAEWAAQKKKSNPDFFSHLATQQTPEILYIGCSDSRVSAEEMTGAQPGQMFVHRNIANVVSNADMNIMSVIEYAVAHLHVKHVVVCGHYGCGGVMAALQPKDLGILNPWLRNIRDVYRLHKKELDAIINDDQKYKRLVELNTEEQCFNVIKTAVIQKHYLNHGYPKVHGWVFDLHNGSLIDLKIDFEAKLKTIQELYDLGHFPNNSTN
ncbi:carbonic anhydrase [Imtechella halotolerans]|uniref:Carbonic anhydrase n=1 Tax=Imtechella halotolerans K1 TaxID=946077 RepID=I0WHB6_9FLAO|nr:carbonic anhydrase [Imtechella halotolerans]EID75782.1 carbonate dehydratase [Imtechella halotolerans K1]WMQ63392.1 carbonic anhydrase [Imtechella halotolerans]